MAQNEWRRRVLRAEKLAAECAFAAEILRFYAAIAHFQETLYRELSHSMPDGISLVPGATPFAGALPRELGRSFGRLLALIEQNGPDQLRKVAGELRAENEAAHFQLLSAHWEESGSAAVLGPTEFFTRSLLQPYAASLRELANMSWSGPTPFLCPYCKRKPGLGVLRPRGDGGQRSLVCSFCLAEWEFRRIVCPGCGEEDDAKLPVYTAEELPHVRVEACDSCRTYMKTVDMTKNGLAEPMVDEMAATALDLWAHDRGYGKLQCNLLQL